MNTRRHCAVACAAVVAVTVAAPQAFAASPAAPHAASVSIVATDPVRIDRQQPPPTVTFRGVAKAATVRVDWGDGTPVVARHGPCTTARAASHPTGCPVVLSHSYAAAGAFTIVATSGSVRSTAAVTVAAVPVAWDPPAGWVQPAGWGTFFGATFTPCETVQWYLDPTGQPADRAGTKSDIAAVLGVLGSETGLRFTEAASADAAELQYSWRDLQGFGSGAVAVGPDGGSVDVTLASDDPYTLDQHGGLGTVHFVFTDTDGTTYSGDVPGRAWLVMRLTGMALGLAPVADPGQAMYQGYFGPGRLGAGDLDGLHTMYLSQPCPVIPD